MVDKDAMQQVVKEEGKTINIVPPAQVRTSIGPELERWKLAAEGELSCRDQTAWTTSSHVVCLVKTGVGKLLQVQSLCVR